MSEKMKGYMLGSSANSDFGVIATNNLQLEYNSNQYQNIALQH